MDLDAVFRGLVLALLLCSLSFARGGGGCLLPGTLVSTVNGERDITTISVGDRVLSFDGKVISAAQVVAIYTVNAPGYYEIRTERSSLNVTGEHLVYTGEGTFKEAAKLDVGNSVVIYLDGHFVNDRVVSVKAHDGNVHAFNLLVNNGNTFLANSLIVHNKGCFLPDTPILTSDGSLVNISQVKKGDRLLAFTYGGEVLNTTVNEIYTVTTDRYYVLRTQNYEVRVTAEHPFYIGDEIFKTADNLQVGDAIYVFNGTGLSRENVIFKELVEGNITAYNLRTDWPNTYFANFIAVHNKGGGCFAVGSKITTIEGEKNIEDIREGDTVLAVSPEGKFSYARVLGTFDTNAQLLRLSTAERSVYTTQEHPFLTPSGFKNASEIAVGDIVVVFHEMQLHYEKVTKIEYFGEDVVYNLEVEEPSTFIADGFVVHNKGGGGGGSFHGGGGTGSGQNTVDNTICGKVKPLVLTNGTVLNASECYYIKYTDTSANIGYASDLQRCIKATENVWNSCAAYAKFATSEMQINCTPMKACDNIDSIQLPSGTKIKVVKPPTLLDQIVGFVCGGACIFFIIGGVILFQLVGSRIGERYGTTISRLIPNPPLHGSWDSGGNLDYCYPESQVDEKAEKTAKVLDYLKGIDKTWDPELLKKTAHDTFLKLQECWESRDYAPMQPLLMPYLYTQHLDQIQSLKNNHEINKIENLQIKRMDIVQVKYHTNKDQQEFTALIEASARDYYVDDKTDEFLRGDSVPATFQEFWVFHRKGGDWLLREMDQTRESNALRDENFVEDLTPMQLQNMYGELAGKGKGEKASWLEDNIANKGDRVHKLLNFLAPADKSWNEDFMKETARKAFTAVLTAFEEQDLTNAEPLLMPDAAKFYSDQIDKMKEDKETVEYRNLCVRKIDLVLVKNFADNDKDEFTVRISAHAQKIEKKGGKIASKDDYVSPFEEYWTFQKQNGEWKLREVDPPASTRSIIEEENIDEESSKDQLQWYYTQDRAV